ncbi:MAG: patatin-like phospholipase family protein [Anaerolineaceae bacterium]|nr:patatin-like phospholipase family protein [Anaerolineaceae bacterium]
MKTFKKNLAIAIDGGGIRGVVVTRALEVLEASLGEPLHRRCKLVAGTSTGSIIAAGIAAGLTAREMSQLYIKLGPLVFKKTLRSMLWPLTRYRYDNESLSSLLRSTLGDYSMGQLWQRDAMDVVITAFDLKENRSRFIKTWKKEYQDWPLVKGVLASSSVPTVFPVVDGRYVDGGVGSYSNPCYLAAYEARYCLGWDLSETTLISLGTGRAPTSYSRSRFEQLWPWQWISPILGAFLHSAEDQQVHLTEIFFPKLDFRRYQVDMAQSISLDDIRMIPRLLVYGEELGNKILNDQLDKAQKVYPGQVRQKVKGKQAV